MNTPTTNQSAQFPDRHDRDEIAELPGAGNIIGAKNDFEAVREWMKAKGKRSGNTFKSYRTEATKILLWMMENKHTFNSLTVEIVHQYFNHLACPPAHWIRPAKAKKGQKLTDFQIMRGGASNKSIAYSRTVLIGLCRYLCAAGYIRLNPFELSHRPAVVSATEQERYLSVEAWSFLWSYILSMASGTPIEQKHADRTRWLFALFYFTGLRIDEAVKGKMCDFVRRDDTWQLKVVGKGSKARFVTVSTALLSEVTRFRKLCDLPGYPLPAETVPLIPRLTHKGPVGLSVRAVQAIVTEVGARAAATCGDQHLMAQISSMTAHWLRHTNATHRLMAGASLETTQDELGHADPRTTRIYAKTSSTARREDAEKLSRLKTTP